MNINIVNNSTPDQPNALIETVITTPKSSKPANSRCVKFFEKIKNGDTANGNNIMVTNMEISGENKENENGGNVMSEVDRLSLEKEELEVKLAISNNQCQVCVCCVALCMFMCVVVAFVCCCYCCICCSGCYFCCVSVHIFVDF